MRKLVVSEFLTLDGVMQGPGDADEDRGGGFEEGGWQLSYFDDVFAKVVTEGIAGAGGFVLGRKTWEIFAGYWPNAPEEQRGVGDPLNKLPKFVVSTTLKEPLSWENSHLISGDVQAELSRLKGQQGKDLMVIGSGNLVQTLMREDLVDEYQLMFHPLVLGSGAKLFPEGVGRLPLELVDSTVTTKGVVIANYRPDKS
jgi:dihydrofolate reductase